LDLLNKGYDESRSPTCASDREQVFHTSVIKFPDAITANVIQAKLQLAQASAPYFRTMLQKVFPIALLAVCLLACSGK
jgi:hypothetical protein